MSSNQKPSGDNFLKQQKQAKKKNSEEGFAQKKDARSFAMQNEAQQNYIQQSNMLPQSQIYQPGDSPQRQQNNSYFQNQNSSPFLAENSLQLQKQPQRQPTKISIAEQQRILQSQQQAQKLQQNHFPQHAYTNQDNSFEEESKVDQFQKELKGIYTTITGTNDYSSEGSFNPQTNDLNKNKKKELTPSFMRHLEKSNLPKVQPQSSASSSLKPVQLDQFNQQYLSKKFISSKKSKLSDQFSKLLIKNEQKNQQTPPILSFPHEKPASQSTPPSHLPVSHQQNIISEERSRKRTEKQHKDKYKHDASTNSKQSNFEKHHQRSMKDIQNDSMRTSYALTFRSFMWSTKAIQQSNQNQLIKHSERDDDNQLQVRSQEEGDNDLQNSMDVEEETVGDVELCNYKKLSEQVSQKVTEQKGFRFKLDRKEKELLSVNKTYEDTQMKYKESWKALDFFYSQLFTNLNDVTQSVDTFGKVMTLLIENQIHFKDIITNDAFDFQMNIGEGSFGQVDLYFFKQSKIPQQSAISNSYSSSATQCSFQTASTQITTSQQQSNLRLQGSLQFPSFSFSNSGQQVAKERNSSDNPFDSTIRYKLQDDTEQQRTKKIREAKKGQISMQSLPVAGKKIKNLEEFSRELFIMQTVQCEYMPRLIYADLEKQLLFMELGLCSLEDLKNDSEDNNYTFDDEFTYQVLLNIIKAIESLLSHVDHTTGVQKPLFHSDIKPSNIMLTVKKYKSEQHCSIKLLLIDYGGASFAKEDYWSFYTPAFVSTQLWQKLVDNNNKNGHLTWEQIRYAEVYAACRSVQYLIIHEDNKNVFQKDNFDYFFNKYSLTYPKTCLILNNVFGQEKTASIHNIYNDVITDSEQQLVYTGLSPQNIPFERCKIFKLSKFYNSFNSPATGNTTNDFHINNQFYLLSNQMSTVQEIQLL